MAIYLRKGGTLEDYVPFSDEEFQRAKALLDKDSRFERPAEGWYIADFGDIQFSDVVNKQVHVSDEVLDSKDPVIRKLIEILHPAFYFDGWAKMHDLTDLAIE